MKSNPFIRRGFKDIQAYDGPAMTISGTRNKTFILLGLTALSFFVSLSIIFSSGTLNTAYTLSTFGAIGGLIVALITVFKPQNARITASLYAIFEGILLGSISLIFEVRFPGIATRALLLTLLAVAFTLLLYREAPDLAGKIRKGVIIATLSIVAMSFLGLIFSLFGIPFILWGNSTLGIGFSLVVVGVAIANLMIDYDNIVLGTRYGLPEYMEWFFAFGLLVTIIWIYLELLRLLSKIASRD